MLPLMAGVGLLSSAFSFLGASSAAQAQAIINKANSNAENKIRDANNLVKASSAALGNYIKSEDTKRKFKAAGQAYNAAGQNIVRLRDQSVKGTMSQKTQAVERLGALTAQASAMGLGGSIVDVVKNQTKSYAREGMREQERAIMTRESDMKSYKINLMDNANASSDTSQVFAGIDYSKSVPAYVAKPSVLSFAFDAIGKISPYMQAMNGERQMNSLQSTFNVTTTGANDYIQTDTTNNLNGNISRLIYY